MDNTWKTFDKQDEKTDQEKAKSLLVIGGSGFIGRHIAKRFLDDGWEVTILNRSGSEPVQHRHARYIKADRDNPATMEKAIENNFFDCTIDLIGHNEDRARKIIEVLFGRTSHHIHLSSEKIYMVLKGIARPWHEDDDHLEIDKDLNTYSTWYTTGIGNLKAEKVLKHAHRERGFPLTIVRPTHVSGIGDSTLYDYVHIKRFLSSDKIAVHPTSGNFRHIQVSDVAEIIYRLADRMHRDPPEIIGRAFNAAGASMLNIREYMEMLRVIVNRDVKLVPAVMDENTLDKYPFLHDVDIVPDISRIEKVLNFRPRGIEQFIGNICSWYIEEYKGDTPGIFGDLARLDSSLE